MASDEQTQFGPAWAVDVARQFHEAYERQAPHFGYETRPESAVEWDDVPEKNKRLMVRTVCDVFARCDQTCRAPHEDGTHLRTREAE